MHPLLIATFCGFFLSCEAQPGRPACINKEISGYNQPKYRLTRPDRTYEMPEILEEISGIAVLNETDILCIQDEAGIVFRYNIKKEKLSGMYRFTDVGDFEDITVQDEMVNVLRSDGTVFNLSLIHYTGESESKTLPLNCMDMEGLYYDRPTNKLLIACKDKLIDGESSKRYIFSLNTNNPAQPKVEFIIDLKEINTCFNKQYPGAEAKKIKLNPSAISIHPVTREIYVLSASDRLLAVYAKNKLKAVYPLPKELFYKPEGISFNKNGDLYIASEGNKKGDVGGLVHYFKWVN